MVIVIAGPTGVGKTGLSIRLAQALNTEIISADSVQVYKKLNIGSAKITEKAMQGIRHHMIDVLEPTTDFDVIGFRDMARAHIDELLSKKKTPILVGGTGFYIQAIVNDIEFLGSSVDEEYRKELYELSKKTDGVELLHKRLMEIDIKSAASIDKNNVKRVIRAIEFYNTTGMRLSEHNIEQRAKSDFYQHRLIVLTDDRARLYDRIDKRVDEMIENDLLDEVRALFNAYPCARILRNAIGYRELIAYIEGQISLDTAICDIKKNSRHFAKRQLTWFKAQKNVELLDISSFGYSMDNIATFILKNIKLN